nr:MAG TPA_asm: nucelotide kinase [Caudoviricetes sp.]
MSDSVKHPSHYRLEGLKGIECIDIIQAVLGEEGFKKFCRGNALKYLIRADRKNGLEDLKKAAVYLSWEISGRTEEADDADDADDEKTAEAAEKKAEKAEAAGFSEEAVPLDKESEVRDEKTNEEMEQKPSGQSDCMPASENADAEESGCICDGSKDGENKEALHRRAEALADRHFARRGRSATWDVEKAKKLWAGGTSPEDICDEIGVNPKTFKTYRFRHPDAFPDQTTDYEA